MRVTHAAPGGTLAHSKPVLSNQSAFHHLLGIKKIIIINLDSLLAS